MEGSAGATTPPVCWRCLQALVDDRGWTGAAEAPGVNYRTVAANMEADRLS